MKHLIIEIKARCQNQDTIRNFLKEKGADFKGKDHQIDTYFKVNAGRLKLREGNIENYLIHYDRPDQEGPKLSNVTLCESDPKTNLKEVLSKALGVKVAVDKKREIYFINNVKFHLDDVKDLGTFVEIEAIDQDGSIGQKKLQEQCDHYLKQFEISAADLISVSYSDLLLSK